MITSSTFGSGLKVQKRLYCHCTLRTTKIAKSEQLIGPEPAETPQCDVFFFFEDNGRQAKQANSTQKESGRTGIQTQDLLAVSSHHWATTQPQQDT